MVVYLKALLDYSQNIWILLWLSHTQTLAHANKWSKIPRKAKEFFVFYV